MRELQCQSLVVKAIREHGGVAFKMANRFLVGVADLFVQLPGCYTYLWEVKLNKSRVKDTEVDLTSPQEKFIREAVKAGGHAGVLSFIQDGHDLYMAAAPHAQRHFSYMAYKKLPGGTREKAIYEYLYAVSHYNWRDM